MMVSLAHINPFKGTDDEPRNASLPEGHAPTLLVLPGFVSARPWREPSLSFLFSRRWVIPASDGVSSASLWGASSGRPEKCAILREGDTEVGRHDIGRLYHGYPQNHGGLAEDDEV